MSDNACEVPLVEKLRSIESDYRTSREIQWAEDGTCTGHQFIPVGYMMHEAADEIELLRAQLAEANRKLQESERENKYLRYGVYEELNIAIDAAISSKGEEDA